MNQRFTVVYTYGRDVRESDIDGMIAKLDEWDKELEHAQHLIENSAKDCNNSIVQNYDRQFVQEMQVREKRENLLKRLQEGQDEEFGGAGPGLTLGKKKSSKREAEGAGSFLSGLRQGFLNR